MQDRWGRGTVGCFDADLFEASSKRLNTFSSSFRHSPSVSDQCNFFFLDNKTVQASRSQFLTSVYQFQSQLPLKRPVFQASNTVYCIMSGHLLREKFSDNYGYKRHLSCICKKGKDGKCIWFKYWQSV